MNPCTFSWRRGDAGEVGAGGGDGAVGGEAGVVAGERPGLAGGVPVAGELDVAVGGGVLAQADGDLPGGAVVLDRHAAELGGLVAAIGLDLVICDGVPLP